MPSLSPSLAPAARGLLRGLAILWAGLLFLAGPASAVEKRPPNFHGGPPPPPLVRQAAHAEALKFRRARAHDTDISFEKTPVLLSAQQTVDFQHPSRPAWLLLYSIGEQGPRAHTHVSQLTLVSATDGQILWKSPEGAGPTELSCPDDMDDAVMVEIMPGRYGLALSCGAGSRWGGGACLLALGGPEPLEPLFLLPREGAGSYTESTGYFVRTGQHQPLALVVHEEEINFPHGQNPTLTKRDFLFRLDPESDLFEQAPCPREELARLIATAARSRATQAIVQVGSLAFGSNAYEIETAAAETDRELNRVYQEVRRKQPPDARERLQQEERAWLTRREALRLDERPAFDRERIAELRRLFAGTIQLKPLINANLR